MRKDLILDINTDKYTDFSFDNKTIGIEGENLQGYLILKLNTPIEGDGTIFVRFADGSNIAIKTEHNETFDEYKIPIKDSLLKTDYIEVQLCIEEPSAAEDKPRFKSPIYFLPIAPSIITNTDNNIEDDYPTWNTSSDLEWSE